MDEYIERGAAYRDICADETMSGFEKAYCSELIRNIPAADVAPVVHGLWKRYGRNLGECSNCGEIVNIRYNYCPNCGARMDLEEPNETKEP